MRSWIPIPFVRDAPVTAACVAACVGLFVLTGGLQSSTKERLELLDRWGAVIERNDTQSNADGEVVVDYELRGPVALWRGQWWRVPICTFHHSDLWHLVVNAAMAVYLGRLVERHFGSRKLLWLLPAAIALPMIVEFLSGNYVVGFSGVVAAMFGVLCVLRRNDEDLAEAFSEEAVHLGGGLLAMGVVFGALDLAPIANLAHLTGFFVGALAGSVATGWPWGRPAAIGIRAGAYALGIAGLWFACHPVWDGAYQWHLAKRAPDDFHRMVRLERAVDLDPELVGAYRVLAELQAKHGLKIDAWKTVVTGLAHNPANLSLLRQAQRGWQDMVATPYRLAARQTLRDIFGDEAEVWLAQIEAAAPGDDVADLLKRLTVVEIDPRLAFPLDRAVDLRLPQLSEQLRQSFDQPRLPPEGDAVEGRRM